MPLDRARVVEIACDESGSEGEKLIGGNTAVFAHASVSIDVGAADACVQELRRLIRSPAVEYKANHLLRTKHRDALIWFLAPPGPVYGRARVFLVEKAFALIQQVASRVNDGRSAQFAVDLYRDGPSSVEPTDWQAFLELSNELLWIRNGDAPPDPAPYFTLLDSMRRAAAGRPAGEHLAELWAARSAIIERPARPAVTGGLNPLVPALVRAVQSWAQHSDLVDVVHDEQSTITSSLIEGLKTAAPALNGVRLVDSMDDARVQVADFLAGVARRIAEDELADTGDAELVALLRPYVDPMSVWGDASSWAALQPGDRGK
jgi:hypothetical protein